MKILNPSIEPLINIGEGALSKSKSIEFFTNNNEWNRIYSDLDNYSHLFILGCVGDK